MARIRNAWVVAGEPGLFPVVHNKGVGREEDPYRPVTVMPGVTARAMALSAPTDASPWS